MLKNLKGIIPLGEWKLLEPFDFNSMYELGCKANPKGTYKFVFKNQGIAHTSIDLNGKHGSIALNLAKPIELDSRDIVTNYGTSEHIMNQEAVFRNIHNLSHHRMIHMIPRVDNSPTHGLWHVDFDFFEQLAEINNYEIEQLYIVNKKPIENVCCSFKKLKVKEFDWDDTLPMQWQPLGHGDIKW